MRPLLILFIFAALEAHAQTSNADLERIVEEHVQWIRESPSDTARLVLYNNLSAHLFNDRRLSAYTDSALALLEGSPLINSPDLQHWRDSMALSIYNRAGLDRQYRQHYTSALYYFEKALDIAVARKDTARIILIHQNQGSLYRNIGEKDRSLRAFRRGLKLATEVRDSLWMASLIGRIGQAYEYFDLLDSAEYFLKASLADTVHRKDNMEQRLLPLASLKRKRSELAEARDLYQHVIDRSRPKRFIQMMGGAYEGLILIHKEQGERAALEQTLDECIGEEILKETRFLCSCLTERGMYRLALRQFVGAEDDLLNAKDLALRYGYIAPLNAAAGSLVELYLARNDHRKAFEFRELWHSTEDSLHANEALNQLSRSEFRIMLYNDSIAHANEIREASLLREAELASERYRRNIVIAFGICILLVAIILLDQLAYTKRSERRLAKEKARSEALLLNILPVQVADELKATGRARARQHDHVAILFSDMKDFTTISELLMPNELVEEIDLCFQAFDRIMLKYGLEKIKTIGDAYMAAGGLLGKHEDATAQTVRAALEMQEFMLANERVRSAKGEPFFRMRVGIHVGPVIAGVVGSLKFQYDIWGDSVNIASRMESNALIGSVNISEAVHLEVRHEPDLLFEPRGAVNVKGKGELPMFMVQRKGTWDGSEHRDIRAAGTLLAQHGTDMVQLSSRSR